ncbi:MAG TPA: hypothetical protein PLL10_10170, partial [Elusimicrobiales bacterium]|nr:hypothetical protein [Elusimicrobiales bacterium]
YTKAYFAAGALYVFIYLLLFRGWLGRLKALVFAGVFAAALWFSAGAAKDAWPAYFNNTILSQLAEAKWSSRHLWNQFLVFLFFSKYLLALLLAPLALKIWQKHTYSKAELPTEKQEKSVRGPDFWLFCLIMGAILLAARFGAHTGAWMTYWLQLLSPFLLILCGDAARRAGLALGCLLLTVNLFSWRFFLLEQDNPDDYRSQWELAEEVMRQGTGVGDVLALPPLEYYALRTGAHLHHSGQSSFFTPAEPPRRLARFFLPKEQLERRLKEYRTWLEGAIERREFALVLLTRPDSAALEDKIDRNYLLKLALPGEMPQSLQAVQIRVYAPIPGKAPAASRSPFRKGPRPAEIRARPVPVLRAPEPPPTLQPQTAS